MVIDLCRKQNIVGKVKKKKKKTRSRSTRFTEATVDPSLHSWK